MRKKRFFLQTDGCTTKSGFGRFANAILQHLYKTGKYEIIHFAVGTVENPHEADRFPWKTIAAVSPQKIQDIKQGQDPRNFDQIDRMAGYGAYGLADAIKQSLPVDVAIFAQDSWGVDFATQHPFFDKITSALHVTIDSRPQPQGVLDLAKRCKNFWCWADFATKDFHKAGITHVKTVRGTIDTHNFFPLTDSEKKALRKRFNIPENDFISIFCARNQLRKGFPNLIESLAIFKRENPEVKNFKFLFHTSYQEGWDINSFVKKFGIPQNEILTTYICNICGEYDIRPFSEHIIDCRFCGLKKDQHGNGMRTTHPSLGVTEKQLCQIYNLADICISPITSGGLEIPFTIESKLCGLPGATTNYSCGEDQCGDPTSGTLALDFDRYVEGASNFEKAWTKPYSIAKAMKKFYFMDKKELKKMGNDAREYALKNFSVEVVGKQFEDFIDSAPFSEYDGKENTVIQNPNYTPSNNENDAEWIEELYNNILMRPSDGGGKSYWVGELAKVS